MSKILQGFHDCKLTNYSKNPYIPAGHSMSQPPAIVITSWAAPTLLTDCGCTSVASTTFNLSFRREGVVYIYKVGPEKKKKTVEKTPYFQCMIINPSETHIFFRPAIGVITPFNSIYNWYGSTFCRAFFLKEFRPGISGCYGDEILPS